MPDRLARIFAFYAQQNVLGPVVNDAFKKAVRESLLNGAELGAFILILREHRDNGLSADAALEVLQSLRAGAEEAIEDRIIEIMDIAAGFCSPHVRVWEST